MKMYKRMHTCMHACMYSLFQTHLVQIQNIPYPYKKIKINNYITTLLFNDILLLISYLKFWLQARTEFLHGIYHQLMMGRPSTGAKQVIHAKSSWSELTMMVQEQMANTLHSLNRAEEKVRGYGVLLMWFRSIHLLVLVSFIRFRICSWCKDLY